MYIKRTLINVIIKKGIQISLRCIAIPRVNGSKKKAMYRIDVHIMSVPCWDIESQYVQIHLETNDTNTQAHKNKCTLMKSTQLTATYPPFALQRCVIAQNVDLRLHIRAPNVFYLFNFILLVCMGCVPYINVEGTIVFGFLVAPHIRL